MFDVPLMLRINWTIVDTIHSKGNKLVTGVKIEATADSKPNDSPGWGFEYFLEHTMNCILVSLSHRLTVLKKETSTRLIMKYMVANSWHIELQFDKVIWVQVLVRVITLLST